MRVNRFFLPGFALLALLLTVLAAQMSGQWITSGKQLVDVENLSTTDDIRGWMTLQQVADGFGVDVTELYGLLAIPPETAPTTALKELEGIVPDFEVTLVRERLAAYLDSEPGAPAGEDGTPAAVDSVHVETDATVDVAAPKESVPTPTATAHVPQADGSGAGPTPLAPGETLPAAEIKGRQTLQEVADQTQVAPEDLLAALGLPPETELSTAVRDLVEQGLIGEIDAVRTAVAELQAR